MVNLRSGWGLTFTDVTASRACRIPTVIIIYTYHYIKEANNSLDQSMLGNHDKNISVFVLTWLTSNIILKSTQVDFGEELKCWVYWALLFICHWPIASLYFDICMQLSKKLGLDIQMEFQESQHSSWHLQDYTGNQFCVQK